MTNDTKLRYLDALAQHRLASSIRSEVDHFLRGLNELIPDNLLGIFDENELEVHEIVNSLLGGNFQILFFTVSIIHSCCYVALANTV